MNKDIKKLFNYTTAIACLQNVDYDVLDSLSSLSTKELLYLAVIGYNTLLKVGDKNA